MRAPAFSAAVASALLLSGCADFGEPIDGSRKLSPTEIRLQAAETKLADVSKRLDALNQVFQDSGGGQLGDEVRSLRGDVEKLRFDLDGMEKRNRDLYQDLDRRLQRTDGTAPATGVVQPSATPATGGALAPPPTENPAVAQEEAAYLQAFDLLKGGKYDDAISGFKTLILKWPEGRHADYAYYWMGKALYLKQDYPAAIQSFQTVSDRFPKSPKAPDALLDLAIAQAESKHREQSRATLQRLVKDYPNSNAAGTARQRLAQP